MFTSIDNNSMPHNSQKLELDQEKNLVLEDFPIRTMKKDMENSNNPQYLAALGETESSSAAIGSLKKAAQIHEQALNDKQKTSPFLAESLPMNTNAVSAAFAPKEQKINLADEPIFTKKTEDHSQSHFSWFKAIAIFVVIFAVLSAIFGGYYFWTTRNSVSDVGINAGIPGNVPVTSGPLAATSISLDKPNYLSIDMDTASSVVVRETIDFYALKVIEANAAIPVEFIVTDSQNNPVSFERFAGVYNLTLPSNVMKSLGDKFSLFIYNNSGQVRAGLAVDGKDTTGTVLKKALADSENSLPNNLEPLFLTSEYTIENKNVFNASFYNGAEVRYLNIIGPEELSVDYAVYQGKFLVGTTKNTLRLIMDKYAAANAGVDMPTE